MRHVALIYDAKLPYDLKVVSGVALYVQEGAEFITYIEEDALKNQRLPDLRSWRGDGVIANFDDPGVADAVLRSRLPAVAFGSGYGWYSPDSGIPYFYNDQAMIGRLAADHLLDRGFRSFGYCGYISRPENLWNGERQEAFAARVASRGFPCSVYRPIHKTTRDWNSVLASLGSWLRSLPKPAGVMGANDKRAHHVLEACRAYQLRVPAEVAVIGVDNDEMLCQLSSPALTSIEQDARGIGYQAAALLDRMMQGQKPRQRAFVVKPVGVVMRKSTNAFAVDDKVVMEALTFVHTRAHEGLKVADVVDELAISRSSLESHFRATIGCTVHQVIRRVQLDGARHMILQTNLAMKQVAANMGFKSIQHMTSLFGKAFGVTPAKYRKQLSR
jgi:LacI family transcriptional regulator